MMRSKAIATGLAIGTGLFANAAPASTDQGGLPVEPAAPGGGVSAEGPQVAPTPGGVPAESASQQPVNRNSIAAKIRIIKRHERNGTPFQALTLDTKTVNPNNEDDHIRVIQMDGPNEGAEIIDPIVLFSPDGTHIARYAGRKGLESLQVIPAYQAQLTEFIGRGALPVENPQEFVTPHTLHLTPGAGKGAVGFTAENDDYFGMMP